MEEFLDRYCYIVVDVRGKYFYYTCALVTNVSETHISFEDTTRNDEPHSYRNIDISEIKLPNKILANAIMWPAAGSPS